MPDITKLQLSAEQARNESLRACILAAWSSKIIPTRENLLAVKDQDSHEILDRVAGRRFNELPFDDRYFLTLTPFLYMTADAICYYVAGYMLNALFLASRATENAWAGMDLPIIAVLTALTEESQRLSRRLSTHQKQCIRGFIEYVRDHAGFFFWEDKVDDLETAKLDYESKQ
jgi:hypothetical protein